ncbi:MAG: cytochrome c biogenesis protein CcsA [Cytophagales bacterium]
MTAGNLGHFFVIFSFVTALVTGLSYYIQTQLNPTQTQDFSWQKIARTSFYIHTFSVWAVVAVLFYIIKNHLYEYHYAWEHSSNILPTHYMISCFWEGQEGSFLLWIFWHTLLGLILIKYSGKWESAIMLVFALVQAFLCSMILGILFTDDFKLGSSPFVLTKEVLTNLPIYSMNPDYVPTDGTGLNPLLQNYWMVIHPPTLFLGFALTLVPFSYCIAGLFTNNISEWVKPALIWTIIAALVLGIGIMMGAYWAYETLNFGGYWNWDPVENAVYVPWLILIAAIHTMIIYKSSNTALRLTSILVILGFILILYSTFLTRSGVLGESSVHSFTDLGLSGQLLVYLLFFTILAIILLVIRWKNIPASPTEISVFDKEFWLFIGVTFLFLMSFQVLVDTSRPVYNAIVKAFGMRGNLAPPVDAVAYYGIRQLIFSIIILLLSGTAQFFYWKKLDKTKLLEHVYYPLLGTGILIIIVLSIAPRYHNFSPQYLVLLIVSLYSIVSNSFIFFRFIKTAGKLTGGAISHIGIAVMLVGILYSAGFAKTVSLNTSGLLISKEMSTEMNQENSLLYRNDATKMDKYFLTYRGPRIEIVGFPEYFNKEKIDPIKGNKAILLEDAISKNFTYFKKGDTVTYYSENTYYQIDYSDTTKNKNHLFSLYPRVQSNASMGQVPSPDIKHTISSDLYTHITFAGEESKEKKWSDLEEQTVSVGDTFFLNDYVAKLISVKKLNISQIHGIEISKNDIVVQADIEIQGFDKSYHALPTYIIKDMQIGRVPEIMMDLGVKLTFLEINPKEQKFTFGIQTTQKDFVVMKASEKPMINLLWIGTLLVCVGMSVALYRRLTEK